MHGKQFFVAARVFESTSVDVGETAVLACYDQAWPNTYESYYIDLYLKSNEVGSNFKPIARYKVRVLRTLYDLYYQ